MAKLEGALQQIHLHTYNGRASLEIVARNKMKEVRTHL